MILSVYCLKTLHNAMIELHFEMRRQAGWNLALTYSQLM